ncbi:uncharacterized protein EDB93DRAFT_1108582 [Suillus bovinus]|uniref:uncharacterized protein n=1 Tax=Suillus bovinus TaxID=48563 RepID=UPI001B87C534|nr:uncharacterized protein EDB93DRAFT_1108582 [Suillus bovinus]KAG2129847.1 hypothetical protein EDB93DRAFT_1108582 [Suillus bovinus]
MLNVLHEEAEDSRNTLISSRAAYPRYVPFWHSTGSDENECFLIVVTIDLLVGNIPDPAQALVLHLRHGDISKCQLKLCYQVMLKSMKLMPNAGVSSQMFASYLTDAKGKCKAVDIADEGCVKKMFAADNTDHEGESCKADNGVENDDDLYVACNLNEDIITEVLDKMAISDVTSTSRTTQSLRKVGKSVILRCFRRLLEPFVGQDFHNFKRVLHQSKGLITGSSARCMLIGEFEQVMRDLNMVVPVEGFQNLDDFIVNNMGYSTISYISHPAIATSIGHFCKYSWDTHIITLASPVNKDHVLHLIFNALTTAGMIYMTTGRVAICTHTSNLVGWDHKLGCAGDLNENLRVETGIDFIGEECWN